MSYSRCVPPYQGLQPLGQRPHLGLLSRRCGHHDLDRARACSRQRAVDCGIGLAHLQGRAGDQSRDGHRFGTGCGDGHLADPRSRQRDRGFVCRCVQDASAAILGLAAAAIAASVTSTRLLPTVVAMIVVTSLATGLTMYLMGRFRLGEIARFVPFPVVGGLLAGTGLLIVEGSVDILGGLSAASLPGDGAFTFWPGVLLAISFFLASRLSWSSRSLRVADRAVDRRLPPGQSPCRHRDQRGRRSRNHIGPFPCGVAVARRCLGLAAERRLGIVGRPGAQPVGDSADRPGDRLALRECNRS